MSLLAKTEPADPAPIMMKSYVSRSTSNSFHYIHTKLLILHVVFTQQTDNKQTLSFDDRIDDKADFLFCFTSQTYKIGDCCL